MAPIGAQAVAKIYARSALSAVERALAAATGDTEFGRLKAKARDFDQGELR